MIHDRYYPIPNKVFFWFSAIVVAGTISMLVWGWPTLRDHFTAVIGRDSANLSNWEKAAWVAALPIIQLSIIFLVSWLYRHPQFFPYPTLRHFQTLETRAKTWLVRTMQHFVTMVALFSVLILAYVAEGMVARAAGIADVHGWMIVALVACLALSAATYTTWMWMIVHRSPDSLPAL